LNKNSEMVNKLAIVLPSLEVGGTEILWTTLARRLEKFELTIVVLSNRIDKSFLNRDDLRIKVITTPMFKNNFFFSYIFLNLNLTEFDHIHCVDRFTLGAVLLAKKNPSARISFGIYHSKEMTWKSKAYFSKLQEDFFLRLFPNNVYFGNLRVANDYAEIFQRKVKSSSVFNAGVELLPPILDKKLSYTFAIIGRHTSFKNYIPDVLDDWSLNNLGCSEPLEVFVVGSGPMTRDLVKRFPKAIFTGTLDLAEISNLLTKVDFVVCGGTTVPIVASTGVPVIIGVENSKYLETHGFFHDLKFDAYNLSNTTYRSGSIRDCVSDLYSNKEDYKKLRFASVKAAKRYDFEFFSQKMELFLFETSVQSFEINFFQKFRYKSSLFYELAMTAIGLTKRLKMRYRNI
jgi:hypothetical protein